MKLPLIAAVSLLSVAFAAGAARADFILNFDENGRFSCNVSGCGESTGPDPTHLVSGNVLIYQLPSVVFAGDVGIADLSGALSDALRFTNPSGSLTGATAT